MGGPPSAGVAPQVVIPSDGDPGTAASVSQPPQQLANHIAYLMKILQCSLSTTSSTLPQLRFVDSAGNGRFLIDHNGLPTGGRVSVVSEPWLLAPGASGSAWSTVLGTAAALTGQSPSASYNARFIQVTPSSTSGVSNYGLATTSALILANTAGMSLSAEWEFGLNAAGAGTTSNTSWFMGFDSGTDPLGADSNCVGFYKKFNSANLQILTGNGSSPIFWTTTTPPTAGAFPTDRYRIEIQGSGSPYAAYQARFYVNETLIQTVTSASLPAAAALRFMFGSANEGGAPSGSPLGFMGPPIIAWNRYTSGPNF